MRRRHRVLGLNHFGVHGLEFSDRRTQGLDRRRTWHFQAVICNQRRASALSRAMPSRSATRDS